MALAGERKAGVQALQKISDHIDDAGEFFFVADDERAVLQRWAAVDVDPTTGVGAGRLFVAHDQSWLIVPLPGGGIGLTDPSVVTAAITGPAK